MQAACARVDLPPGPMLALIEDETGSGKTEAALILAQRMLRAGKGAGFYVVSVVDDGGLTARARVRIMSPDS